MVPSVVVVATLVAWQLWQVVAVVMCGFVLWLTMGRL